MISVSPEFLAAVTKVLLLEGSFTKPGDSCINQLLAITHEMYQSFDACLDAKSMFLEISKAFDKVWYQSILYKLKQSDITGNLLEILTDFLKDQSKELY